jgi:PAS domain S-box-containing protein
MGRALDRTVVIGLGLVAALLVLGAAVTYRNTSQLDEDARWVSHTHEVLDLTGDLLGTLVDAETGQRGFLVTGQDEFLEPYNAARTRWEGLLVTLKQKTQDNATQQTRIQVLEQQVRVRFAMLQKGIKLRRGGANADLLLERMKVGKAEMDGIRQTVAEMKADEHDLLRVRERRSSRSYAVAVATGILTAVLGLLMVGAFVWMLDRNLSARQKAAAVAHEQRELLHTTLTSIGDAVIATDAKGRITFLNRVAHQLTGWRSEDAAGQPLHSVFRIVNEETRQPAEDPATRSLRQGTIVGLANHTVLIAKDGSERPIDDSAAPIRNEAGAVAGVVMVFRDVAERRRLEGLQRDLQKELERQVQERTSELRASEERFRLLVESTRDYAIFMLDPTGRIATWNPGAERINGYRAEEIIGQHFSRFYPEEANKKGWPEHELEVAQKEGRFEEEGWRVRKDGSRLWASVLITALYDEAGKLQGFSKITRDLTARKQAEEDARKLVEEQAARQAAEEAERRAHFLAGASGAFAALVDERSTLQKLSRLAVPFFADWCAVDLMDECGALSRVAVAHVDPSKVELAHELSRRYPSHPEDARGIYHILRTGQPELVPEITEALFEESVHDPEYRRILRELGLQSYMAVPLRAHGITLGVITFIAAESGRHYGATDLAVAEDLADRAGIAVENARLYSRLRETDRLKDEFLAMLSHELRNPLAPIRNALHIMKQPGANGNVLGQVREMAERQVQHMARLLDDLLDVSRISRGMIDLRKEPVNVAYVVTRTVEVLRPLVEERRHELMVSLPEMPALVEADPTRLEQVVSNLLHNSVKYTDPGGHIWLTVESVAGEVIVRVRDDGTGIAPEMLPRIFDLFVQADRRLDRSQGGVGIGLTLVKRLVEMHGGSVEVHSAGLGQGSEFMVRLPALRKGPTTETTTEGKFVSTAARPHRVLIVDDNEDSAESLALLLRLEGQDVRVAYNGPAAMKLAEEFLPEMVFLDIGMPGMDGYEVARRLRTIPQLKNAVLVAQTGWGQDEDRQRSREAGFKEHLVKPTDPTALRSLLESLDAPTT